MFPKIQECGTILDRPQRISDLAPSVRRTFQSEIHRLQGMGKSISSQVRPSNISYRNREEMRNGIICIEAIAGDSFEKIAEYYGIKLKKILQYNDKKDTGLKPGEMVYLKRKKTKAARGYEFHRVKAGDTLYDIAQQYGIRLKSVASYNYLYPDSPLTEGEKIFLRKKADLL